MNPRQAAWKVLVDLEETPRRLERLINHHLDELARLDDRRLASSLVYTVLRHRSMLDHLLAAFSRRPLTKLAPKVLAVLRLGASELALMRTPDHAAVSQSVELAKTAGLVRAAGLVNGVLRAMARGWRQVALPGEPGSAERLAVEHSHPRWLVDELLAQMPAADAAAWLAANQREPPTSLRANTARISPAELAELLLPQAGPARPHDLAPECLVLDKARGPAQGLPGFGRGLWQSQDPGAAALGRLVGARSGMRVLDLCAGAGGKTGHLAALMRGEGELWAVEPSPGRHRGLKANLERETLARLVTGQASRNLLDKVQMRHPASPLTIPPHAGVLTSCSMYLKEHYVVLNQGDGNFGIHTSAVVLDPVKTFGTNIMLEIYNQGDQPVVNPMVSVEIFRAPENDGSRAQIRRERRKHLTTASEQAYAALDEIETQPTAKSAPAPKPRLRVTVKGQNATMPNPSLFLKLGQGPQRIQNALKQLDFSAAHPTLLAALEAAPSGCDTLVTNFFPNLLEQVELLGAMPELKLKRVIFRHASRTHGFFLSHNAHTRLDTLAALGVDVYWFTPQLGDLYLHVYKKDHGFFLREEASRRFQESTILAFYGSAAGLDETQSQSITHLIDKLTDYMAPNVGMITGGGGGVMGLACEQARAKGCLTGACFLELEAQPPELGVDFFNTFQESSRHFRQKWFEVADFCVFNVGGVGTLEEIGIEMCNLKLGIRPRVPFVFYDARYFRDLRNQVMAMIQAKRAPDWMADYLLFTDDADEVVDFYRQRLQVL